MEQPWRGLGSGGQFESGATLEDPSLDTPVGLVLSDSAGFILRVNRVFCDITARSEQALLGVRYAELVHPADRVTEDGALGDLMRAKSGARHRLEERLVRPDGEVRWVAVTASLLPRIDASGQDGQPLDPVLLVRRVVDTTDSRRLEAERDRYFGQSPAGIMVFGLDGRFKRVNPAAVDMLGWSEDELVGRSFVEFAHPDEQALSFEMQVRLFARQGPVEYEGRMRTRAGRYRWIRATATAVQDEGLVYAWIVDIHERKQAEQLIRESEERFRRMFDESPSGGAVIDPLLRLQKANAALSRMLDRPAGTLEGANLAELTHPEDAAVLSRLTRSALTGAIPSYEVEARLLHEDGSGVWVAIRASVVRDGSGEPLYVLQIIDDIGELRDADTARREIEQLKDRFLALLSHDLQNSVLTINQLARLAEKRRCGVDVHHEAVSRIVAQAERLQYMVVRLLDFECLYHGNVVTTRRPTDVAAVVKRVALQHDSRHPLSVEVAPLVADVDPDHLERILENLLENAIDHTQTDGPVVIRVERTSSAIEIAVDGAGRGGPDGLRRSVFDLVRTDDPALCRSGIGLWIVARYAELNGGEARVEDRPGGGRSFRVILPTPKTESMVEPARDIDLRERDGVVRHDSLDTPMPT